MYQGKVRNMACKTLERLVFTREDYEKENREKLALLGNEILSMQKDEDGLYTEEGTNQEELLLRVLPTLTLFETELNKKEHYNDIVFQCRQAVKKYPASVKIFSMLSGVLETISEQIFEHYKTIQTLMWEQYEAVKTETSDELLCALAKGCYYKAFLLEKYEAVLDIARNNPEAFPKAYREILRLERRFDRRIG